MRCGPRRGSASDESQEVCIDHISMHGHQAVGIAGVDLERAMLEQLGLQQGSILVGHNLVIVALDRKSVV